jgi:hypothetical protein
MKRARHESGQAIVTTVLFLTVLIGLAAAVLDVGAWFRTHRQLQTAADASALAGAQALPDSPAESTALALEYAAKNGGGVTLDEVSVSATHAASDTIEVRAEKQAPGILASLFGLDSVAIAARAKARSGVPGEARWAAPIVVDEQHPMLQCDPPPCTDETQIHLHHLHKPGGADAAGSFGLINLDRSRTGEIGADTLGEWLLDGFEQYMSLGIYRSVPSAKFNSIHIRDALKARLGDELLFPIYRTLKKGGAEAEYDVIGWVGFGLDSFAIDGDTGKLYGSFTRVIWEGILSESASGKDFGVRSVELVE